MQGSQALFAESIASQQSRHGATQRQAKLCLLRALLPNSLGMGPPRDKQSFVC